MTIFKIYNLKIYNFEISEISKSSFDYTTHHHNFGSLSPPPMEADCQESSSATMASMEQVDINKLFTALSTQIMNQNSILQDQIKQNDLKMSSDFQLVVQANDDFKRDVRAELDDLHCLLTQQQNASRPSSDVMSINPIGPIPSPIFLTSLPIPSSSSPSNSSTISPLSPGSSSMPDVQTQMTMMLTESFSKLSTFLVDKNSDTKSDWPKFLGDSEKFRAWYLAILAQMSLSPWQELYDSTLNNIVLTTSNTAFNGKLYVKLLISLEGLTLQHIVTYQHFRANGLLLLQELVKTYKPKNVPEVITFKTSEFWGST